MISKLTRSNTESFQKISNNSIKCCICSDTVLFKDSFMTNCKHSWCNECNNNLNKHNISNCPVCKNKFKNFLLNGKWELNKVNGIYMWKWNKGINDSKKKLKIRKVQQVLSNMFVFEPNLSFSV